MNSYLAGNPELRQLSNKAGQLTALQRQYEQLAPISLIRHSHVLHLQQKILTLAANNGAIAAKLRQLAPELIQLLQNRGCEVTVIQVRVQVSVPPPVHTVTPARLSEAGKKHMTELAEKLADSPLKNALQRLVKISRSK
ncbi:MAG: DciA family protein [Gallionellaceae bacterium]